MLVTTPFTRSLAGRARTLRARMSGTRPMEVAMQSTMQDFPLTIEMIFRHGRKVYGDSEVVTWEGESARRATFAQVADRAEKLAAALKRLGVELGDRVGTFCWNTQEH